MWRSVPQIPVLRTRISTSLIPISGWGTFSSHRPSAASPLINARMRASRYTSSGRILRRHFVTRAARSATGQLGFPPDPQSVGYGRVVRRSRPQERVAASAKGLVPCCGFPAAHVRGDTDVESGLESDDGLEKRIRRRIVPADRYGTRVLRFVAMSGPGESLRASDTAT